MLKSWHNLYPNTEMLELNFIQKEILGKLLYAPSLNFSQLQPREKITSNLLAFHLQQLQRLDLISKKAAAYTLTDKGKEFANRSDSLHKEDLRQKNGVIMCCYRKLSQKAEPEFLIYTRKKHPFFGSQGYPSGKIRYGETLAEAAQRELLEETNLQGIPQLFLIQHHLVYDQKDHRLLEDKFFFFNYFDNPTGELHYSDEGDFTWVKFSDFPKFVTKPFESLAVEQKITRLILSWLKNPRKEVTYQEVTHITDSF